MPAANKSEEIAHLIRDKGYPTKRAVAAAYSMERAGKFRGKKRRSARRTRGRR